MQEQFRFILPCSYGVKNRNSSTTKISLCVHLCYLWSLVPGNNNNEFPGIVRSYPLLDMQQRAGGIHLVVGCCTECQKGFLQRAMATRNIYGLRLLFDQGPIIRYLVEYGFVIPPDVNTISFLVILSPDLHSPP